MLVYYVETSSKRAKRPVALAEPPAVILEAPHPQPTAVSADSARISALEVKMQQMLQLLDSRLPRHAEPAYEPARAPPQASPPVTSQTPARDSNNFMDQMKVFADIFKLMSPSTVTPTPPPVVDPDLINIAIVERLAKAFK